jgi:proteic killer suppression protein
MGMSIPNYRLHQLKGDRQRQRAVWVSGNWRIVFTFDGEDATEVDLVDYH